MSIESPSLTSPELRLTTLKAAGPTGNPSGTRTARRRRFRTESRVVTASGVAVREGADCGMERTSLFAAEASKVSPVTRIVTPDEAPDGLTAESEYVTTAAGAPVQSASPMNPPRARGHRTPGTLARLAGTGGFT